MDLFVTMKFRCPNMVDWDVINNDFNGDLMAFMRWMLTEDHIISFEDGSELIAVEVAED
jgi:hypothetical protein